MEIKEESLLKKSFKKSTNCYSEIGGEKVYHYDHVIVSIEWKGGTKTWTITRARDLNAKHHTYHMITCSVRSSSDVHYHFPGTRLSNMHSTDESFAKAINRIEKIVKKHGKSKVCTG
jgi:hypothetical protein